MIDGGVIANNPTDIALQEAESLWPTKPIGCIVSLGTGQGKEKEIYVNESMFRDHIGDAIRAAT